MIQSDKKNYKAHKKQEKQLTAKRKQSIEPNADMKQMFKSLNREHKIGMITMTKDLMGKIANI